MECIPFFSAYSLRTGIPKKGIQNGSLELETKKGLQSGSLFKKRKPKSRKAHRPINCGGAAHVPPYIHRKIKSRQCITYILSFLDCITYIFYHF